MKKEATLISILNSPLAKEYFRSRHGLVYWRQNTGGTTYGKQFVKFGIPGAADFTGILKGGRRVEIECKADGKKQTASQEMFQEMIEGQGGIYILCYDKKDVIEKLNRERRTHGKVT